MITDALKKKIQTVVNVFETSSLKPRYDVICIANDGPGKCTQISYGKQQCAEFGNLHTLIKLYCDNPSSRYGKELKNYLQFIGDPKHPLCNNADFKQLLKYAGTDFVMHQTQDQFFDQFYWTPALNWFTTNGFTLPLSMLVAYDSFIQSGGILDFLRKRFGERPPAQQGDEKEWILEYVQTRDQWLENHSKEILRATDYRTDTLLDAINAENWDLSQPIVCKFNTIDKHEWVTIY